MNGRLFFDTNILVYAYDTGAPEKQTVARKLLTDAIEAENGVLSVQVLPYRSWENSSTSSHDTSGIPCHQKMHGG